MNIETKYRFPVYFVFIVYIIQSFFVKNYDNMKEKENKDYSKKPQKKPYEIKWCNLCVTTCKQTRIWFEESNKGL